MLSEQGSSFLLGNVWRTAEKDIAHQMTRSTRQIAGLFFQKPQLLSGAGLGFQCVMSVGGKSSVFSSSKFGKLFHEQLFYSSLWVRPSPLEQSLHPLDTY